MVEPDVQLVWISIEVNLDEVRIYNFRNSSWTTS